MDYFLNSIHKHVSKCYEECSISVIKVLHDIKIRNLKKLVFFFKCNDFVEELQYIGIYLNF